MTNEQYVFNGRSYDFRKVAEDNGLDWSKWANMSPGLRKMNMDNVLLGKKRRGEYVKIGEHEWNRRR